MDTNFRLLSAHEAAVLLNMLSARVKKLAKAGVVPHVVLPDGEIRFIESELVDWVRTHRRPDSKAKP